MKRSYWKLIEGALEEKQGFSEIDISLTPMENIKFSCDVLGCNAIKINSFEYRIKLYRIDLCDAPIFNVDTYVLFNDFEALDLYPSYVKSATTDLDANMEEFHKEAVMIFMKEPESDHWSTFNELPENIQQKFVDLINKL